MNIGEKLYELRKEKNLSQEEVADKLNVTRQTISKWETNQSTPDFDKIKPLCELYEITADELLTGEKKETEKEQPLNKQEIKQERAQGIAAGVLFYFIALVWIMISIPVLFMNPILAAAIFILLCGLATYKIIYTCMVYKKDKIEKEKEETNTRMKSINKIIDIFALIIYLFVSFTTMAWFITWIIFIIAELVKEIVKLLIDVKGEKNEE
ncbi:MAG: helix-turn-helix domain-containing protein [Bacilli bacterium]